MLTEERHDQIRAQLASKGKVLASVLAGEFGVSEDTARRDLRDLARNGFCRRVYGGALPPAPDLGAITQRSTTMIDAKEHLAAAVAGLVKAGQTIFIDAGSTNLAVARTLSREMDLTIVTNAPGVAVALSDHPLCRVIMLGGVFNPIKGACLGGQTVREVQRIHADVLVLGSCGVDPQVGVTALDAEEAELKRCMVQQSRQVVVPATLDKLGTVAPYKVADSSEIDVLVLPNAPDAELMALFMATRVRILTAP